MRLLGTAVLLFALVLTSACSASPAADDTAESASLSLEFDTAGKGRVRADLASVGSSGLKGSNVRRRWIGLDSSRTVMVDGVEEVPHAEVSYDASTVVLVNGMFIEAISAHPTPLELDDVTGWPAIVDYVRVEGSPLPRATRIDVQMPPTGNPEGSAGGG